MLIKLDIVDNQPILTNLIDWRHDDIISDITVDRFHLEFSIFQACEYYNLTSLHPMFTKLDVVDNQPKIERRHDDVISDVIALQFWLKLYISSL